MNDRTSVADALLDCPLLIGLDERRRMAFLEGLTIQNIPSGDPVLVQGELADSAFVLVNGTADIVTRLPGGGETQIASVGPGSVLGEIGLLLDVPRSATVRAQSECRVLEIPRRVIDAWLAQSSVTGLSLFRNLARMLALRAEDQRKVIGVKLREFPDIYTLPLPIAARVQEEDLLIDVAAILPRLPAFGGLNKAHLDGLYNIGRVRTLGAGAGILGQAGLDDFHIIVRGAAVTGFAKAGRCHPLAVLGPGSFLGFGGVLNIDCAGEEAMVLNTVTVLTLPRVDLGQLIAGQSMLAAGLLRAMAADRAQIVSRFARHTTRLTGLARLSVKQTLAAPPLLQSAG